MNWKIIGHRNITEYLGNSIVNGRLAHAYLFYGAKNLGKKEMAMRFIQALLCHENQKENGKIDWEKIPCGECHFCREIGKKSHPDFFWLEKEAGDKNISVEQIRELKEKLSAKSFFKSYKVAVISGAEEMSTAAANALLKVLEEPLGRTIIILVAERIDKMPKTIISRSQKIKFLSVNRKEVYDFLVKEKNINREAAWHIATISAGRPGTALAYASDKNLWQKYVEEVNTFFKLLAAKNHERLKFAETFLAGEKGGVEQREMLVPTINFWQTIFRDILLFKMGLGDIIINSRVKNEIEKLAPYFGVERLEKTFEQLEKAKSYLKQNANPKLVLENLLLNF